MVLGGFALKRDSHAADVVEGVAAVQTEEVAIIAFTEPVAELRHDQPVLDFLVLVLIQRPRVVGTREVEGRALTQPIPGSSWALWLTNTIDWSLLLYPARWRCLYTNKRQGKHRGSIFSYFPSSCYLI